MARSATQNDLKLPDPFLIEQVIITESRLHPLARPVDYYKLLFQSIRGPGHMISDINRAQQNILHELSTVFHPHPPFTQDIDSGYGFIRLYLGYILMSSKKMYSESVGQLSNILAKAMFRSAQTSFPQPPMIDLWRQYLPCVKQMIKADDDEWLDVERMALGNSIPSHSNPYKQAYDPHYRVLLLSEYQQGFES